MWGAGGAPDATFYSDIGGQAGAICGGLCANEECGAGGRCSLARPRAELGVPSPEGGQ